MDSVSIESSQSQVIRCDIKNRYKHKHASDRGQIRRERGKWARMAAFQLLGLMIRTSSATKSRRRAQLDWRSAETFASIDMVLAPRSPCDLTLTFSAANRERGQWRQIRKFDSRFCEVLLDTFFERYRLCFENVICLIRSFMVLICWH